MRYTKAVSQDPYRLVQKHTRESDSHLLKKVEYDNDIKSDQEQLIYFQSLWAPLLSTAYLCAFKGSILTEMKTLK